MSPKKILHFAIGPIGSALLGFISLPIVAWIFSQEDVGRIALLNVVLSFSTLFFTLGLDQGYVRDFHESNNKPLLLKTAFLPGFMLLFFWVSVCLVFNFQLSELVFSFNSVSVSWLLIFAIFSGFLSRFLSLVLRMNERGLAFSMSQLLPKVFFLLIILSYLFFKIVKSFEYLLLAHVTAIVFACIIFSWSTYDEWRLSLNQKINFEQLREMLRFGLPLTLGGVAFWGLTSLDRILLSYWSSYNELAIYSISVSFAAAATIFQSVFSTVWAPTVYKWASNDEGYEKVIKVSRYVLILVTLIFCMAGLASWLVPFILPAEYEKVQWILITSLAYPLFYTLSETTVVGVGIARKTTYAMLACILSLLINIIFNYILIPKFGAAGAASSMALAFWCFLVLRTEFSIRAWKVIPRVSLYVFSLLCVVGAILGALLQDKLGIYIYVYWFTVLFVCCWKFKSELSMMIEKVLKLIGNKNK
ncbi:polysaccharide biosynthesis protein [Vibrio parahaemolyticus]|uniref:lipopolysaccharide biosynthesis protein n=1 Tax=Vibrio parahaemolyticus TaxID=670 RepID=UPI0009B6E6B0|nr:oligosaccharide flippase family protein [Vibrio parahaemolyticus]OQK30015.1 polysaccharide biosynthesis protein [Vibrio parahaemolyticus]